MKAVAVVAKVVAVVAHGFMLHGRVLVDGHLKPPFLGATVCTNVMFWVPPSHSLEHGPQSFHIPSQ